MGIFGIAGEDIKSGGYVEIGSDGMIYNIGNLKKYKEEIINKQQIEDQY